jgi:hypothetical protein
MMTSLTIEQALTNYTQFHRADQTGHPIGKPNGQAPAAIQMAAKAITIGIVVTPAAMPMAKPKVT